MKTLKKVIALLLVSSISFFSIVSASGVNAQNTPSAFLNDYLFKLKEGRVSEAFSMQEDTRYQLLPTVNRDTLSAEQLNQVNAIENGAVFAEEYAKKPIANYTIRETVANTNIILTSITFIDGEEAIVPFNVVPNGDTYKIVITDDDITEMGYQVTKEAENYYAENNFVSTYASSDWSLADSYDFWELRTTIYGLDTFYINKPVVNIVGEQWNQYYEDGWELPAKIKYAIVKHSWLGDDTWGEFYSAITKNGYFDIKIYGKNSNFSNAVIRISSQTGDQPLSKGGGNIYIGTENYK